jgi:hypothetical protein
MVPLFSRQPPAANAGHTSVSEICRTISVYQIAQVGRREGLQSPAWRCDGSVEGLLRIICPLLRYAISLMRRQKKKKSFQKGGSWRTPGQSTTPWLMQKLSPAMLIR